jgi:RHH-type proline utilization regulon transcriptional repressor/proline dehydrogenase/delta 1-pyrroline-5-carboxylate dehydrogenase
LYVNRGITGAIVQRQPFGGWKRSAVGTGTKAGGPHYVASLGRWVDDPTPSAVAGEGDPLTAGLLAASADVAPDRRDWLAGALGSDAVAWTDRFGAVHDPAGLQYEVNAFRYQAVPVTVRAGTGADVADVVRVVGAGLRAGAPLLLSVAAALPTATASALAERGVTLREEGDQAWAARVADIAREAEAGIGARVRLVGADVAATVAATGGSPDVALHAGEVTSAGEVELLPFLREQAVSITAHRFGAARRYDVPVLSPAQS